MSSIKRITLRFEDTKNETEIFGLPDDDENRERLIARMPRIITDEENELLLVGTDEKTSLVQPEFSYGGIPDITEISMWLLPRVELMFA